MTFGIIEQLFKSNVSPNFEGRLAQNIEAAQELKSHRDPLLSNTIKLMETSNGNICLIFIIKLSITQIWNMVIMLLE